MHILDFSEMQNATLEHYLDKMSLVSKCLNLQSDHARYLYLNAGRLKIQDCRNQKHLAVQLLVSSLKLKTLDFTHFSECTDADLDAICQSQSELEIFHLKGPRLTNEAVTALKPLKKLRELSILETSYGVITDKEVERLIKQHSQLKKVDLYGDMRNSPIENLELQGIKTQAYIQNILDGEDLPDEIRRLAIASWQSAHATITRVGLFQDHEIKSFLSALQFLKIVKISGEISKSVLEGLKSLPHLEDMTIQDCYEIREKVTLKDFVSLRKVTIVSSHITEDWCLSHLNFSSLRTLRIQNCYLIKDPSIICNLASL